jgi:hypothetical protein
MIYKLSYPNKDAALADLTAKGIYIETEDGLTYGDGVAAIVEIGLIMIVPPVIEDMEIVTAPVYADGYHYDVMSTETYDFGFNLVDPKNPKHAFAGHDVIKEEV